jgi:hypothetical protein
MVEKDLERTVGELLRETDVDFINIPMIAEFVREDLDIETQDDIRRHTLDVVGRLMTRGVYPGEYDHAITLEFWPGEPSDHLRRIKAEWIAIGKTPTLAEPICWLGLKLGPPGQEVPQSVEGKFV